MIIVCILRLLSRYQINIKERKEKKKSTKIPSEKSVKKKKEKKKNSPGIHKIDLLLQQEQPHVIIVLLLEFALLSQQLPIVDFVSLQQLPSKVIQVIHKCMIVAHFKFFNIQFQVFFYIFLFFYFSDHTTNRNI